MCYLLMFSVMALATVFSFWWWGWRIIIAIHLLRGNKHLTFFFLNHLSGKLSLSLGEHQLFIPYSATIPGTLVPGEGQHHTVPSEQTLPRSLTLGSSNSDLPFLVSKVTHNNMPLCHICFNLVLNRQTFAFTYILPYTFIISFATFIITNDQKGLNFDKGI